MKVTHTLVPAIALAVLCTGCVTYKAPVVPPLGAAFNFTSAPMNLDLRDTGLGSKRGEASCIGILGGLVSFGDSSIHAAAKDGRLTTVHHADSKITNVLTLFFSHTTVVYGN